MVRESEAAKMASEKSLTVVRKEVARHLRALADQLDPRPMAIQESPDSEPESTVKYLSKSLALQTAKLNPQSHESDPLQFAL